MGLEHKLEEWNSLYPGTNKNKSSYRDMTTLRTYLSVVPRPSAHATPKNLGWRSQVVSLRVFSSTALSAIGGEVTKERKVRNNCDEHDCSAQNSARFAPDYGTSRSTSLDCDLSCIQIFDPADCHFSVVPRAKLPPISDVLISAYSPSGREGESRYERDLWSGTSPKNYLRVSCVETAGISQ
ncbi:hypothetical protein B9Z19DRAFT_1063207 [Tuber borchii]|uniref:Uncharacterized protein n=1 Tax=Tuber borchii TaxID=42251 RepID=A0A2T6ZZ35_TUBBO|nr:hypothetical protein B9Z19DRAFT_1063207 [Tuber borchii]